MASIQQRGERFQLRVKHRLLPRPFFFTFDTEGEARAYGDQLESLLHRGIVPQELLAKPERADEPLLSRVASDYSAQFPVTRSDEALLKVVIPDDCRSSSVRSDVSLGRAVRVIPEAQEQPGARDNPQTGRAARQGLRLARSASAFFWSRPGEPVPPAPCRV